MAGMSWRKPPPVVIIGGTEDYLRDREIRNAIRVSRQSGKTVVEANDEGDVLDALSASDTFGIQTLVVIPAKKISPDLVQEHKDSGSKEACILLTVDGALDDSKLPAIAGVHGAYRVEHTRPTTKSGLVKLAERFVRAEADALLPGKGVISEGLTEALTGAVGTDLGMLHFELYKMCALARSRGETQITKDCVQELLRPSSDIDLGPLREALKLRSAGRVAGALDRIRRRAPDDPTMLLLRGKGGPADLVVTLLRASLMGRGVSADRAAERLGIPTWAYSKDIEPALKNWKTPILRELVGDLASVDRAVLLGSPSPWVALVSALLRACRR